MKKRPGYRTSQYHCNRCEGTFPLEGETPATYLTWTEAILDAGGKPTREGRVRAGLYCPACRAEVEASAVEIDSFVL